MSLFRIDFAKYGEVIESIFVYADNSEDAYIQTIENDLQNEGDNTLYNDYVDLEYSVYEMGGENV